MRGTGLKSPTHFWSRLCPGNSLTRELIGGFFFFFFLISNYFFFLSNKQQKSKHKHTLIQLQLVNAITPNENVKITYINKSMKIK